MRELGYDFESMTPLPSLDVSGVNAVERAADLLGRLIDFDLPAIGFIDLAISDPADNAKRHKVLVRNALRDLGPSVNLHEEPEQGGLLTIEELGFHTDTDGAPVGLGDLFDMHMSMYLRLHTAKSHGHVVAADGVMVPRNLGIPEPTAKNLATYYMEKEKREEEYERRLVLPTGNTPSHPIGFSVVDESVCGVPHYFEQKPGYSVLFRSASTVGAPTAHDFMAYEEGVKREYYNVDFLLMSQGGSSV